MNNIDISKYIKKNSNKSRGILKKTLTQTLLSIIICLIIAIICKKSPILKNTIYKNVYDNNFSFTYVKSLWTKYLGKMFPIEGISPEKLNPVFSEKLKYNEVFKYMEGVSLSVSQSYLVPIIESGIVVYIGDKEKYGKTIIIQGMDGIDIWYGNINTSGIKLYDYVEKGSLLGEVNNNTLYLAWMRDGNFLNYEEYLQ